MASNPGSRGSSARVAEVVADASEACSGVLYIGALPQLPLLVGVAVGVLVIVAVGVLVAVAVTVGVLVLVAVGVKVFVGCPTSVLTRMRRTGQRAKKISLF